MMPASHFWALDQVLDVPLPMQFPIYVPGKAAEDGSSAWAAYVGHLDEFLGSWLHPSHYSHLWNEPVAGRSVSFI